MSVHDELQQRLLVHDERRLRAEDAQREVGSLDRPLRACTVPLEACRHALDNSARVADRRAPPSDDAAHRGVTAT